MQKYRITQKIHADTPLGVPCEFTADEIVTADDILPGCLESMTSLRQVVAVPDDESEPAAPLASQEPAESDGEQPKKNGRKK